MEFKCGDIVNVKFKPKELNPYVITGITKSSSFPKSAFYDTSYSVKSYRLLQIDPVMISFEVSEDEIELHISEVRNNKLKELGV